MPTYLFKTLLAICCFIYICASGYLVGLARDYEVIGHGLIPVIALPLALLMVALAFFSYRLAFSNQPIDNEYEDHSGGDLDNLEWPVLSFGNTAHTNLE